MAKTPPSTAARSGFSWSPGIARNMPDRAPACYAAAMPVESFVHLHTHSSYSLSEGAIKAEKLPALAKEAGMPAVALTDTANLFGALEFSQGAAGKGVQPIMGCQLWL